VGLLQTFHRGRRVLAWAVVAVAAVFFLAPIVWLLLEPTRTAPDALAGPALGFGSLHLVGVWWQVLLSDTGIGGSTLTWIENSALYSGSGVLIAVAFGLPAGYALATVDFIGRRALLIVTMIAMLIPSNALVLPLVLEAHAFHLLGSPLAVILPYGLFPFGVYMAYLYFNTPRIHHLLASARIDGCNDWQAFRQVALPLSAPVIGLIMLLDFVASWTNYFLPFLMYAPWNATGRYPVSLGIAQQLMGGTTFGTYIGNLDLQTRAPAPEEALLLLATAAPVIVVLLIAQRWIASGRLAGVFGAEA